MNVKNNVITNYVKESFAELSKVTWPTKNQAVKLTIIVLVFCLIMAILIGAVDLGFNKLYEMLLDFKTGGLPITQ